MNKKLISALFALSMLFTLAPATVHAEDTEPIEETPAAEVLQIPEETIIPEPAPMPSAEAEAIIEPSPVPAPSIEPENTPVSSAEPTPAPSEEPVTITPEPAPEAAPLPSEAPAATEPEPSPTPEATPEPEASTVPEAENPFLSRKLSTVNLMQEQPVQANSVATITTYEELDALFTEGGYGRLGQDIDLEDKGVIAEKDVVLDMNNKTIRAAGIGIGSYNNTDKTLTFSGTGTIEVINYISISKSFTLKAADTVSFKGKVYSAGLINGGTFYGNISSNPGAPEITNGIFHGEVTSQKITGGTFYGSVSNCVIADSAKVTVQFIHNGATVSGQIILKGQSVSPPDIAELSDPQYDYEFDGWYTAPSGGTKVTDFSKIERDTTYYAHTTPKLKQYTVTWDANGGSTYTPADGVYGSVDYGKAITAPSNAPERENYTFAGWYDAAENGSRITSFGTVSKDVTFYAQWTDTLIHTETQLNNLFASGGTGKLGSDITLTSNTSIAGNVSLNMNGHNISGSSSVSLYTGSSLALTGTGSIGTPVYNNGTIISGTFTGNVINQVLSGTISNGTFNGTFKNYGTVNGGTYNCVVENLGNINGGAFNGRVNNANTYYSISNGLYTNDVYSRIDFRNNDKRYGGISAYALGSGEQDGLKFKDGSTISLTTTPNDGWHFVEWKVLVGNATIDNNAFVMPKDGVRLEAVFNENPVITFAAEGGSVSNSTIRTNSECRLDAFPSAERSGYTLKGWVDDAGNPVALDKVYDKNTTLHAQWKDVTSPTGKITINNDRNAWSSLVTDVSFDLHLKNAEIAVEAADNSGTVAIEYLASSKALTEEELRHSTFAAYTGTITDHSEGNHIIYVKLTDPEGNTTYLSTDGFVIDQTAPVVKDIEDGKEYVGTQAFALHETNIDSVTINGNPVDFTDNKILLSPAEGNQVIIVKDKAGHSTTITITVHAVRMIEGLSHSITTGSNTALTFRSNADYANFSHVEINGIVIDPKYYTVWSGSTYMKLSEEYVSSLSTGLHTISIVSTNGTASASFTVNAAQTTVSAEYVEKTSWPSDWNITLYPAGSQKALADGTLATSLGDGTYYDQNNVVWDGFGKKIGTLDANTGTVSRISSSHNATAPAYASFLVPNTGDSGIRENLIALIVSLITAAGAAMLLNKAKE